MSEDVRIAMTARTLVKWPQRCPRCRSTSALVERAVRLQRFPRRRRDRESAFSHFINAGYGLPDSVDVPVLTCRTHARSNQLGASFLRRDTLGSVARLTILVGIAWLALLAAIATQAPGGLSSLVDGLSAGALAYAGWSLAGVVALAWAHRVAWARPLSLDARHDTVTLRFRDADYARDFRALNPALVDAAQVARFPASLRVGPAGALVALACGLAALALILHVANP